MTEKQPSATPCQALETLRLYWNSCEADESAPTYERVYAILHSALSEIGAPSRDEVLSEAAMHCDALAESLYEHARGPYLKCAAVIRALKNAAPQGGLAERRELAQAQGDDASVMGVAPAESASRCVAVPSKEKLAECYTFWNNYSSLSEPYQDEMNDERRIWLAEMQSWFGERPQP